MLTEKELIDAFLTGQTIFYGESIFKDSEGLGRFSACKVIKVEFMVNRLAYIKVVNEDGIIHNVHRQDFMNLFDPESLRDKLNFSLASNNSL